MQGVGQVKRGKVEYQFWDLFVIYTGLVTVGYDGGALHNRTVRIQGMAGFSWLTLVKYAGVLIAAIIIGNWFLAEVKKAHRLNLPWYRPYVSVPGLIILIAVCLPLVYLMLVR